MEIYKPAEEVIYADKVEDELCVEKGRIENEEQWTNERPLNEVKWSCKLWKNPKQALLCGRPYDKELIEIITLDEVLRNMNIQDKGLESIAMAQISPDGLQETSAFRHQFLVCVWKQLQKICSTTTVEKGGAWQHSRTVDLRSDDSYLKSVALLKQMYDEESISICMSKFETSKSQVIMVSLLGFHCLETLNGPTISCI